MQAAGHVTITGNGSAQSPFLIGTDLGFGVTDSSVFNLSLSGLGTVASPWLVSVAYAATAKLSNVPDVNAPTPTNAQVLGWDSATSKWTPRAPTTAASGSVTTDTTLTGDGSGGSPLSVREAPTGFIDEGALGIKITDAGINMLARRFGTTVDRGAASPVPVLNSLSMLDANPGEIDYWTGTTWKPVANGLAGDFGTALLPLSGAYAGSPVTIITRTVSFTTDATGVFDVLTATDLAGKAGVLSVSFTETGTVPYHAMVYGNIDHLSATAYRVDDGTPYASQALTGSVTGYLY